MDQLGRQHAVGSGPTTGLDANAIDVGDYTPSSAMHMDIAVAEQVSSIHRVQVAQTVRSIPLLLMFHAAAALSVHNLSAIALPNGLVVLWHALVVVSGAGFAMLFALWRSGRWHNRPEQVLRLLELLCLGFGLVWAMPAAASIYIKHMPGVFPVAGISLAVLGIATVSLLRVPTGATVFVALVCAALARALFVAGGSYGAMAALVCGIYGLVLIGTTLNSHLDFLRRSKAEIEVHRQNQVIKLLLNDFEREARDWLWETDYEGRLTHVSRHLAELLQEPEDKLRLRPWRHVLADLCLDESWRRIDRAMAHEEPVASQQLDIIAKGQSKCWQVTAHPLRDRMGRFSGYRGVCRDVTATREAQRRSDLAMEASEKASAAKSQFLAVMSHELRTPINAIVGFSELLARDKDNSLAPVTRREFAETILQSSRHLQDLINDLLDATRMEQGTLRLTEQDSDTAELVEIAVKLCRDQAHKNGISIVARLVDGVTMTGDVTRLKQVLINLIVNAVKFSLPQGIVNVEMQRGLGDELVVAIKDAGIGIAVTDLERVFDPFVQAEGGLARRYGGVGLGLPIARRIARLHDGDVTLDSQQGAGTTARLVLPAKRVVWPKAKADIGQNVA